MTDPASLAGKRVAIANRGEIAVRIAATCDRLGMIPVLLAGTPDRDGFAARQIGRFEPVGEAVSELDVALVVAAALRAGADFLHPGYGFLSERTSLAEACIEAGIAFVGPSPATLALCGDKLETRAAAVRAGVPVLPASDPLGDEPEGWLAAANQVGYPLLVKPAGAGGGRGLRHVPDAPALIEAVAASKREVATTGAGAVIYLERELVAPRHIEVQVVADRHGPFALGDRDCSLQRRHQKVIEEAPAPNLDAGVRERLHRHACDLAAEVGLRGIATCEFLMGRDGILAFLEVNPRIQVEHPVTELVTGVDLVEWQLRIAAGHDISPKIVPEPRGHAVEARVYAEDPDAGFRPAPGTLGLVSWPVRPNLRVDAGYASFDTVPHAYDAMLAKVVAHGMDRNGAIAELRVGLRETIVTGVATNLGWLLALLDEPGFRAGQATTGTALAVAPIVPGRTMAVYAALASLLAGAPDVADAWSAAGPWRSTGAAPVTFHGDDWETRFDLRRSGDTWTVRSDGTETSLRWWREEGGLWRVVVGNEVCLFAVSPRDGGFEVAGRGGRWRIEAGPRPATGTARQDRPRNGLVLAPMPGSVAGIHVAVGEAVVRGQALVTLSAMKMEIACDAPHDGIVEAISCHPGGIVTAHQPLVTIRVEDAAGS